MNPTIQKNQNRRDFVADILTNAILRIQAKRQVDALFNQGAKRLIEKSQGVVLPEFFDSRSEIRGR